MMRVGFFFHGDDDSYFGGRPGLGFEGVEGSFQDIDGFVDGGDDDNVVYLLPVRKAFDFCDPVERLGGFHAEVGNDGGESDGGGFVEPENVEEEDEVGDGGRG